MNKVVIMCSNIYIYIYIYTRMRALVNNPCNAHKSLTRYNCFSLFFCVNIKFDNVGNY